jgi:hypothetical protein
LTNAPQVDTQWHGTQRCNPLIYRFSQQPSVTPAGVTIASESRREVSGFSLVAAPDRPYEWGWGVHPMWGMWRVWGIGMMLMMLVFWGVVIVGIVLAIWW